jgi:hypothetical protein
MRRRPSVASFSRRRAGHPRSAVAGDPDDGPVDAGVQVAAPLVLGEEGIQLGQRLDVRLLDAAQAWRGHPHRGGWTSATHLPPTIDPPYRPGMDRRHFLLTSLAGALTAPLAAKAQQTFSGSCQAIFP